MPFHLLLLFSFLLCRIAGAIRWEWMTAGEGKSGAAAYAGKRKMPDAPKTAGASVLPCPATFTAAAFAQGRQALFQQKGHTAVSGPKKTAPTGQNRVSAALPGRFNVCT